MEFIKVSDAVKYDENPFLEEGTFVIDQGQKTVIAGKTSDVLVDHETGEVKGMTMLHKYKQVDREQFVKIYVDEIKALFGLSKSGLKVFGYVLNALQINRATIYIDVKDLMSYCGYNTKTGAYRGLSELITNKIIAPSKKPNLWFVNPSIVFNGDRIAFIKEYRLRDEPKQKQIPNL